VLLDADDRDAPGVGEVVGGVLDLGQAHALDGAQFDARAPGFAPGADSGDQNSAGGGCAGGGEPRADGFLDGQAEAAGGARPGPLDPAAGVPYGVALGAEHQS
jgi:hypothetical protein